MDGISYRVKFCYILERKLVFIWILQDKLYESSYMIDNFILNWGNTIFLFLVKTHGLYDLPFC